MSDSPTPEAKSDFVCDCDEWMRSACAGQPFYKEHEGKRYCVLHVPIEGKNTFWSAVQRKLSSRDFNFAGVWFSGTSSFENVQFSMDANFRDAYFNGEADFEGAAFDGSADFTQATFNGGAFFSDVTFQAADFSATNFKHGGRFIRTTFGAISFQHAIFTGQAIFVKATFKEGVDFLGVTFGQEAPFDSADFSGAVFWKGAEFGATKFISVAGFYETLFKGPVNLSNSVFGGVADFRFATFHAVFFLQSIFNSEAKFQFCTFQGLASFQATSFNGTLDFSAAMFVADAYFNAAVFRDYARFAGIEDRPMFGATSSLDLQVAKIEAPDRVLFHTAILRPHWFVNVNAREFDFLNVTWRVGFDEELEHLKKRQISSAHARLSKTFRDLAINSENNHRYEQASRFRYWSMDTLRRETWRGLPVLKLSWWYWLASGYGEQAGKAAFVLFGILLLCGTLYTRVGIARMETKIATESDVIMSKRDGIGAPLRFWDALLYSAYVMTLQKPEPRPATRLAQTVVLLETILGPVQAALLALAIRRKFMR